GIRHVPESVEPSADPLDWVGGVMAVVGLGGTTYAIIGYPDGGLNPTVTAGLIVGVVALVAFVLWERATEAPMVPFEVFRSRQFTGANLATFVVYSALGGVFFMLVVHLQTVAGFTATGAGAAATPATLVRPSGAPLVPFEVFPSRQFTGANLATFVVSSALGGVFFMLIVPLQAVAGFTATGAGAASIPVMLIMLFGSPLGGRLAQRIGPRLPLTIGPLLLAGGMVMMGEIPNGAAYISDVLPSLLVFGVGLTLVVTPVTATVLAAVEERHAGLASGINNAVARTGQLLAVAALPALAGLT